MRVLVTGSRKWTDTRTIFDQLRGLPSDSIICHGGAPGADTIAGQIAKLLHLQVVCYPAEWKRHGRRAGPIRNQLMLDDFKPELVLAFPGPDSVGTWDMVDRAEAAGVLYVIDGGPASSPRQSVARRSLHSEPSGQSSNDQAAAAD